MRQNYTDLAASEKVGFNLILLGAAAGDRSPLRVFLPGAQEMPEAEATTSGSPPAARAPLVEPPAPGKNFPGKTSPWAQPHKLPPGRFHLSRQHGEHRGQSRSFLHRGTNQEHKKRIKRLKAEPGAGPRTAPTEAAHLLRRRTARPRHRERKKHHRAERNAPSPLEAAGTGRINGAAPGSAARTEGAAPNLLVRACFGVQRSLSGSWKHAGSLGARREHKSSGKEGALRGFIYRARTHSSTRHPRGFWKPAFDPGTATLLGWGGAGAKSAATVLVPGGANGVKAAESSAGPRGLPAAGGGFGHAEEVRVRLTCARCALAAHNPLGRIWTPPAPPQARQQHEPTWKGFGAVRPLAPDPLGLQVVKKYYAQLGLLCKLRGEILRYSCVEEFHAGKGGANNEANNDQRLKNAGKEADGTRDGQRMGHGFIKFGGTSAGSEGRAWGQGATVGISPPPRLARGHGGRQYNARRGFELRIQTRHTPAHRQQEQKPWPHKPEWRAREMKSLA
ncbi:hypothetical protein Anapl_17193 [Anas platyrhynchos]|uniref:Uncharacterized protein n=1 Tax=Anas platyrhynchos TaxID=8839 RepID=R0KJK3_ANAPL|nr:hypothetical protein Anapl_17193 [Anas platyrhynchos]